MDQDKIAELERLGALLRSGAITQDEFESLKKAAIASPTEVTGGPPPKISKTIGLAESSQAGQSGGNKLPLTNAPKGLSKNTKIGIAVGVTLALMLTAAIIYEVIDGRNRAKTRRLVEETVAEYEAAGGLVIRDGQKAVTINGERVAIDENLYVMPDVICMNLQDAQDLMQEITGSYLFYSDSYEVGGNSSQIRDRNWVVVKQSPAADEIFDDDDVPDFGVVGWLDGPKLRQYGCE